MREETASAPFSRRVEGRRENLFQAPERLRVLVELVVRAVGAKAGALELASSGETVAFGTVGDDPTVLPLHSGDGVLLGHLLLKNPTTLDGLQRLVEPLLADLVRHRRRYAMEAMRLRVKELERELHHRAGNVLQTVASFLRMQVEEFESRRDATLQDARNVVEDARMRVLVIGAVHATMEAALLEDGTVDVAPMMEMLCARLDEMIPQETDFRFDLADLHLERHQASAFGMIVTEFALAAMRDSFPRPECHAFRIRCDHAREGDRDSVTLTLNHHAAGYDTGSWIYGAPALSSRIVEAVATQMDALVAIDRCGDDDEVPGMRLRLAFDRPVRGDDKDATTAALAAQGANDATTRIPGPPQTFASRLGVHGSGPTTRKP